MSAPRHYPTWMPTADWEREALENLVLIRMPALPSKKAWVEQRLIAKGWATCDDRRWAITAAGRSALKWGLS